MRGNDNYSKYCNRTICDFEFKLDVWYVDHVSLLVDLEVVFLTIKKVLKREGISQEGQATMEMFNGNN